MNLKNKIRNYIALFIVIILAGCTSVFDTIKIPTKEQKVVVAVILPLSGKYEKVGNAALNSILMSYQALQQKDFILKIYDTNSSPDVAKNAAVKAYIDNASIILGSLTKEETEAIMEYIDTKHIPVFTLSNNTDLTKEFNNVYISSPTINVEIEAIMEYAINTQKSKKIAVLVPDNTYGRSIAQTAFENIKARGDNSELVKIVYYPTNTAIIRKQIDSLISKESLDAYNKKISANENLDLKNNFPTLDFDTLLIGDFVPKRVSLVAIHLPSSNINYKKLTILGTSGWDNPLLTSEQILNKSYFANLQDVKNTQFYNKYMDYYGNYPSLLEFVAYDTITFISSLIYKDADNNTVINRSYDLITNKSGIKTNLGSLSFRKDRVAARDMIINQITQDNETNKIKELSPEDFIKVEEYPTTQKITNEDLLLEKTTSLNQ